MFSSSASHGKSSLFRAPDGKKSIASKINLSIHEWKNLWNEKSYFFFAVEERPKHSTAVARNPPGCQTSRRISRTSRRSSSIGCRSLMIGRRSSAGLLAWTSCQDPSRVIILYYHSFIMLGVKLNCKSMTSVSKGCRIFHF